MGILLIVLGLTVLAAGAYIGYEFWWKRIKKKGEGKIIRILLFEQIGNDKVYRGQKQGLEKTDDKLGVYILISGIKRAISDVSNRSYFPDDSLGKCLMVCKYADDDFRVIDRMRDNEWFKRIELSQEEYLETEQIRIDEFGEELSAEDERQGNIITQIKLDEDGESIPLIDVNGNPLEDYRLEPYAEPLGVAQDAREAMRFNRSFVKRMEEKRKEKDGFWEKYGPMMVSAFVVMICMVTIMYGMGKYQDMTEYMVDAFAEESEKAIKAVNEPTFVKNLMDRLQRRNTEETAPPK